MVRSAITPGNPARQPALLKVDQELLDYCTKITQEAPQSSQSSLQVNHSLGTAAGACEDSGPNGERIRRSHLREAIQDVVGGARSPIIAHNSRQRQEGPKTTTPWCSSLVYIPRHAPYSKIRDSCALREELHKLVELPSWFQ